MVKRKKNKAKIFSITNNGEYLVEKEEIKESVVQYFKGILEDHCPITGIPDFSNIPNLINEEKNEFLSKHPGMDEVHKVVMSLNSDASGGPDGYTT